MAASGVTVKDEVVAEFNNIKLGRKYQYIQLKLTANLQEIEVEKTVNASDKSSFEDFARQLPSDDCRYAVYDYHFETGNAGSREQLIFVVWCPESAKIRHKMVYASSKDALKKKLVGIANEIQATDQSDLNEKDITAKIMCKMVK